MKKKRCVIFKVEYNKIMLLWILLVSKTKINDHMHISQIPQRAGWILKDPVSERGLVGGRQQMALAVAL